MGQPIEVEGHTNLGEVVMFDTDRSITGQDGVSFSSQEEAEAADDFPGVLAARVFAHDASINHVFIASNQVSARRPPGWSDSQIAAVSRIISDLFLFYPEG